MTRSLFLEKAESALRDLLDRARSKDELNFALSLAPEFKAYTLTSAMDAQGAFKQYGEFLALEQFKGSSIHARVALLMYCHVAEAAGLWCIPMCMLRVLEGHHYSTSPFNHLVIQHKASRQLIAPNANKVMGTLSVSAHELGLIALSEVFRDAFDHDIRNGFSHADYALGHEGVHVRGRHDTGRIIAWPKVNELLHDGIGLLDLLGEIVMEHQLTYQTPKIVYGTTYPSDPTGPWLIYCDPLKKTMSVSGGAGNAEEELLRSHHARQTKKQA